MKNIFFAFLVIFALGCGENSQENDGPGLRASDGGVPYCEVPSPTGDVRFFTPKGIEYGTVRDHVLANINLGYVRARVVADDVSRVCVGWTLERPAGQDPEGSPYPASCPKGYTQAECDARMTAAECADAADDMVDTFGRRHCWVVTTDSAGKDSLSGFGVMASVVASINVYGEREVPVCSTSGKFLGWVCARN
jgi:hypothetical protein